MFQPEEKNHNMQMRKKEKVKVQYASKERLKVSALPYMQRLVNKHFHEKEN